MNKKYLYLLVLIIVLLSAFFIFIFFRLKNKVLITPQGIHKNSQVLNDKTSNEVYDLANTENNEEYCVYMEDQYTKDLCYESIALNKSDAGICSEIKDDNIRLSCNNGTTINKANEENNILLCGELEDKKKQQSCFERLFNENISLQDCEKIEVKKIKQEINIVDEFNLNQHCRDMVNYREAESSRDIKKCQSIYLNPLKAACLSKLMSIPLDSDSDKDGLSFLDEIINNTDPEIVDTDGDGFTDGDEVKNGYSPTLEKINVE